MSILVIENETHPKKCCRPPISTKSHRNSGNNCEKANSETHVNELNSVQLPGTRGQSCLSPLAPPFNPNGRAITPSQIQPTQEREEDFDNSFMPQTRGNPFSPSQIQMMVGQPIIYPQAIHPQYYRSTLLEADSLYPLPQSYSQQSDASARQELRSQQDPPIVRDVPGHSKDTSNSQRFALSEPRYCQSVSLGGFEPHVSANSRILESTDHIQVRPVAIQPTQHIAFAYPSCEFLPSALGCVSRELPEMSSYTPLREERSRTKLYPHYTIFDQNGKKFYYVPGVINTDKITQYSLLNREMNSLVNSTNDSKSIDNINYSRYHQDFSDLPLASRSSSIQVPADPYPFKPTSVPLNHRPEKVPQQIDSMMKSSSEIDIEYTDESDIAFCDLHFFNIFLRLPRRLIKGRGTPCYICHLNKLVGIEVPGAGIMRGTREELGEACAFSTNTDDSNAQFPPLLEAAKLGKSKSKKIKKWEANP